MSFREPSQIGNDLIRRLHNSCRIAIIGVGDPHSPIDRLGMYAAGEIEKLHLANVQVFLAGTAPESITAALRVYRPDHCIFMDAADMGLLPGDIKVLDPGSTQSNLVSSHVLPLSLVMEFIAQDTGSGVTLIGIQPDIVRPDRDLSEQGQDLLNQNLSALTDILRSCQ